MKQRIFISSVQKEFARERQALKGEMTRRELQAALDLKDDEHFRKAYLLPAVDSGLIEMTIPEKPQSSRQKYRLTEKGKAHVAAIKVMGARK